MSDFTESDLAALELERTLNLVQKFRRGVALSKEDRAIVDQWFAEQKESSAAVALKTSLADIITAARKSSLEVPLHEADNLSVIRCTDPTRDALTRIVEQATTAKLRVKWLNDSTLVAIGLPKTMLGKD